jgi:flagellar motility protein MotE (MotC chaperone)
MVDKLRELPAEKQDEIFARLVARQRNAELLSEMNLQAAARVGLILRQLQHDLTGR